jgi:DNA-binding beta-propeller fold protein YncE
VDRDGRIYVSDTRVSWVDVLTVRGKSVARLELPAPDDDPFTSGAGAIAIDRDGTIFVATRGDSGRVHVFDSNFRHVSTWGTPGTEPGQMSMITGIAVGPDGRVAVCCVSTKLAVQIYDRTGTYLAGFGVHDQGAANFSLPSGVTYTADGRLWVLDGIRQTVSVFSGTGALEGLVGGMGQGPGQFQYPCALASDGRELLVVAERVGNRVQVLRTR